MCCVILKIESYRYICNVFNYNCVLIFLFLLYTLILLLKILFKKKKEINWQQIHFRLYVVHQNKSLYAKKNLQLLEHGFFSIFGVD